MKQLKYKALISDIDGTLIPNISKRSSPSVKIKKAIKDADKIIHVGVATSRPLKSALRIINDLDLSSPCILSGGAQIYDPIKKEIIFEKNIEKSAVNKIFKIINKYNLVLLDDGRDTMSDIKEDEVECLTQFWIQVNDQKDLENAVSDFSNIPDISIHKIISRFTQGHFELIINHTQATKQFGIQKVAEILGIKTHEIIGVGDGYNDFPLLMACGLKVAMGNAAPELKEIADYIAPSVEEDGIADAIERFVLNG